MSDERPSAVLGALPSHRPHRRSQKRAAPAPREEAGSSALPESSSSPPAPKPRRTGQSGVVQGQTERLRQTAQPSGVPPTPARRQPTPSSDERQMPADRPESPTSRHIIGTAAQAATELAEIGLSLSARAVRNAIGRLPRP